MDASFKGKSTSDWFVVQAWGRVGANAYLLDQHRAKMDFTAGCAAIAAMQAKYPTAQKVVVEEAANGIAIIDALRDRVPSIVGVSAQEARAYACQGYFDAKQVRFPEASLTRDLEEELASFPLGPLG